jgi:hypothetical protein
MSVDFVDASGKLTPSEDIEASLLWINKKIVKPDVKDPEGVMLCLTIKYALEELLAIRGVMAKAKADLAELGKGWRGMVCKCGEPVPMPTPTNFGICQKCKADLSYLQM